ncbi:Coq4 family protein [Parerythrobacter aurantius]|uniref:Coq4 family protein n=1 Tax=Parerythrobacter aurantius TaxID=3127706 RepID=UPI003251D623
MNDTIRSFPPGTLVDLAPDGTLFRHPERPAPRRNLRAALYHFRELLKDKEETSHVFKIFEALPSGRFLPMARAFTLSREGQRVRESEKFLPDILDDHDALRRMPAGSVAHAYCDFMEQEGLTAAGLVEEGAKAWPDRPRYGDLIEWYAARRRDTHDLLHVLTGYGRDALGEQCVLAFTYGQAGGLAHLFIAYLGALNVKRGAGNAAPVLGAVRQAHRMGAGAPCIAEMPVRQLLKMPLGDARSLLKIGRIDRYHACHSTWREHGIDPYNLLASVATAA